MYYLACAKKKVLPDDCWLLMDSELADAADPQAPSSQAARARRGDWVVLY
jgi:hypothetical protein